MRGVWILGTSVTLQACGPPAVDFAEGMKHLNDGMKIAHPLQLSDYDTDVGGVNDLQTLFTPLSQYVASLQCTYETSNPVVPVVTGPVSLAVQVSTTKTGTAQVTIAAPLPSGQIGGSYARADQEGVTIPITFVSAINLSDFYLGQVMPYFANLGGLPAPPVGGQLTEGQKRVERMILHELQTRDAIRKVVADRINEYLKARSNPDPPAALKKYCESVPSIHAVFVVPAQ
jgi:hypothetical protein